ncbi:MAG: hypothetical protein M1839_008687 [Geoglossum umbratile]|nr:MAG: hypothetical protein M1839_008687 [Geoglossum umbratile]
MDTQIHPRAADMAVQHRKPTATFAQSLAPETPSRNTSSDVLIAVMGVTGSGKSALIRTITGRGDIVVGHGLNSTTQKVESYRFPHNNINFFLIDTPGFDGTTTADKDILGKVAQRLESSYRNGTKLTGIIYLHRISEPRMQGSELRNLRMFKKLCGDECFRNVILATTFWEQVDEQIARARERELCETATFWGDMIERGSQIFRVGKDQKSGLAMLSCLAGKGNITLQIQDELVMQGLHISQTGAARAMNKAPESTNEQFAAQILVSEEQRIRRRQKQDLEPLKAQRTREWVQKQQAEDRECTREQQATQSRTSELERGINRIQVKATKQQNDFRERREIQKAQRVRDSRIKRAIELQSLYSYELEKGNVKIKIKSRSEQSRANRRWCQWCGRTIGVWLYYSTPPPNPHN